jgi:UDP-N-acetyl-D-glucosamine dehydrogenase
MTLDFLPETTVADRAADNTLAAIVGLGHVGLSSAIALRRAGLRIVGIETSPSRLTDIRTGRAGLSGAHREDLRSHLQDPDFVLSGNLEELHAADLVLICVPTPVDRQRRPNPAALERACSSVVGAARAGQTLVLASTGYVGSTRELLVKPLAERGLAVGEDVFVAFSAEPGEPGTADRDHPRQPRVIGAVTETCFRRSSQALRHVCQELHRVSTPEVAEMVKLYESTFRAVGAALAFELADACRTQGVDPIEVADAAATARLRFMAGSPSAAIGGERIDVNPHYLLHPLRERSHPATLAEEAVRTVDARPRRLAMRAHELLLRSGRQLRDARVLVVGASCEPGAGRDAPVIEIIGRLRAAEVQVDFHDPLVPMLLVDGEEMYGVDPDPRRDASGFGPEDYDLAVLISIRPGYDYGWLRRCPQVLDCTYREHTGRRRYLP